MKNNEDRKLRKREDKLDTLISNRKVAFLNFIRFIAFLQKLCY